MASIEEVASSGGVAAPDVAAPVSGIMTFAIITAAGALMIDAVRM